MGIEEAPVTPGDMEWDTLSHDPVAKPILEEESLRYLQTEDAEWFNREFSGELDSEGYLLKKDGTNSNTKPSQNITGGMQKVVEATRARLNHV